MYEIRLNRTAPKTPAKYQSDTNIKNTYMYLEGFEDDITVGKWYIPGIMKLNSVIQFCIDTNSHEAFIGTRYLLWVCVYTYNKR